MRLRLLRRRLTISAPSMSVRSALPWPVRWLVMALMLGLCAAVAVWAFEFGKGIAGLDSGAKEELTRLRVEVDQLRANLDKAQSIANTSGSLLTAEKATQEKLAAQIRALEADNRALRDDLGFFERLIPTGEAEGIAIRGLQAEPVGTNQLRWQVLVMQPQKNAPEFNGALELQLSGLQAGKPWSMGLPQGPRALQLRQYQRMEGTIDLPPQTVVKMVTAKVTQGGAARASQNIKL